MSDKKQTENLPIALYKGKLPIGDVELGCVVLDDDIRLLTATSVFEAFGRSRKGMNSRLEIQGMRLPPFLATKNLEPYINQEVLEMSVPIQYKDGSAIKTGYTAALLPEMCEIYLKARRDDVLTLPQKKLATQAEILLSALAKVGIDALIDEATGYQYDRKHDALKILLSKYIAEGLRKWLLTFPDGFFAELDRLYGNEKTVSQKRPQYYGKFINKYVYAPIEDGYVKSELNKLNIDNDGKRRARFHQWLTDEGRDILLYQIGRVLGLMEDCPNIKEFKSRAKLREKISIAPYLFDEMNKVA